MDYDQNRPVGDPMLNRDAMGRRVPSESRSWLAPGLLALALVLGAFYFMSGPSDRNANTAANNHSSPITTNVPTQTPAPIPGPAKTAP